MANNNYVDVIINGKVYTLGGEEDGAYLQKIAAYINGRMQELKKQSGFVKQSADMQNILMQLNIADDYFKAKEQIRQMEQKLSSVDKEMYMLKHDLISTRIKLEEVQKKYDVIIGKN